MAITRTAMVDDDGSGTTGTIINNAWKQELYGQIDAALAVPGGPSTPYTPADLSGAGLTFPGAGGAYVKVGALVVVAVTIAFPATANGSLAKISLPPVAPVVAGAAFYAGVMGYTNIGVPVTILVDPSPGQGMLFADFTGALYTNALLSGKDLRFMAAYCTAA